MTIRTAAPKVGDQVLVIVPPHTNNGLDHRPGVVTHAGQDGTHVHVHGGGARQYATVYADRASADEAIAGLVENLPHWGNEDKGINPRSGEAWHPSDVADWHSIAYLDAPELAPAPDPVEPPETAEDKRARLIAELAALDEA